MFYGLFRTAIDVVQLKTGLGIMNTKSPLLVVCLTLQTW